MNVFGRCNQQKNKGVRVTPFWILVVIATILYVDCLTNPCSGVKKNYIPFGMSNHGLSTFPWSPSATSSLSAHNKQKEDTSLGDFASSWNNNTEQQLKEYYFNRFRKFRTKPYSAPHINKVLLLSDLHMDYPANQEWLLNLCKTNDIIGIYDREEEDMLDYSRTMIIIAGDVSHDLDILKWTFQTLQSKFAEVSFTIGNHELWLDKEKKRKVPLATKLDANDDDDITTNSSRLCQPSGKGDGCTDSLEKLEKVLQLCVDENVHIGPVEIGSPSSGTSSGSNNNVAEQPLWVIPLLSWHHLSFDTEPQIEGWGGIPTARKVVADYRRTVWPSPLSSLDSSVAEFLDGLNGIILDLDEITNIEKEDTVPPMLLTFSHFLPRIELLPEKRYLSLPTLHSCVGSMFLETRLRQLNTSTENGTDENPHLHAFGHSHLAWDQTIDGIRYVHVPLAYPKEWQQRRRSLEIGSMKGEVSENRFPVCIWDGSLVEQKSDNNDGVNNRSGFPSHWLGGWWSKYYTVMPRQPHRNAALAPWAAKRFRQVL